MDITWMWQPLICSSKDIPGLMSCNRLEDVELLDSENNVPYGDNQIHFERNPAARLDALHRPTGHILPGWIPCIIFDSCGKQYFS